MRGDGVPVEHLQVGAYTVPTEEPESDGTLDWEATTIVVVEARAAGHTGVGYTYEQPAAASLIARELAPVVVGEDCFATQERWADLERAVRNIGRKGLASYAIAAVDIALWDLKARLLDVSLATLLDAARPAVPVYGSGGFTSYSVARLCDQLAGWVDSGIPRVKMKVGRAPDKDPERVAAAREAIGGNAEMYVDANGAYTRKQAVAMAHRFAAHGVSWYEEPVSSDDLEGLRLLRDRSPAGMDISAGEYATVLMEFRELLDGHAVDYLQADVTRCGGLTGFAKVAALCDAAEIDLSTHTAPHVSAYAGAAVWHLRHLEWFHDHVRVERLVFDGVVEPDAGAVVPDRTRPGLGLELKRTDAERYAA